MEKIKFIKAQNNIIRCIAFFSKKKPNKFYFMCLYIVDLIGDLKKISIIYFLIQNVTFHVHI
jgi:hypothetical protein